MPDWIGPAAYVVSIAAIGILIAGTFQFLSDGKRQPIVSIAQPAKAAIAQSSRRTRHIDTPETAPELSPLYPTPRYSMPAGDTAGAARKLARETGRTTRPRLSRRDAQNAFAFESEPETTGFATSDRTPEFSKPEPMQ
jgi:hypothetical protein